MNKILIKTTVEDDENDWCVNRFELLQNTLKSAGYNVESRDRLNDRFGNDIDFQALTSSDYDQLWVFAVEGKDGGLTMNDAENIDAFRRQGKGCMLTRDHMNVGNTLVNIPEIGLAHHFHSVNPEPDKERQKRDDTVNMKLDWPNYHSGLNGSVQEIEIMDHGHPLIQSKNDFIRYFPTHPHEGAISIPKGTEQFASVIAKGKSKLTGNSFDLIIAFEANTIDDNQQYGRAVIHSSFHHFADYNWDVSKGCPDFVFEPVGNEMSSSPQAQRDIRMYSVNLANWLSNQKS
ncbi:MAG: hypothetical protein AAFN93_09930 [Bacteroidota bacterium]